MTEFKEHYTCWHPPIARIPTQHSPAYSSACTTCLSCPCIVHLPPRYVRLNGRASSGISPASSPGQIPAHPSVSTSNILSSAVFCPAHALCSHSCLSALQYLVQASLWILVILFLSVSRSISLTVVPLVLPSTPLLLNVIVQRMTILPIMFPLVVTSKFILSEKAGSLPLIVFSLALIWRGNRNPGQKQGYFPGWSYR